MTDRNIDPVLTVSEPSLTITRGLPGSGKTTWAETQRDRIRVNFEDLLRMMYPAHWGPSKDEQAVPIRDAADAVVGEMLSKGLHVIVDGMHLELEDVEHWRMVAFIHGARFIVKDFTHVPLYVCISQDATRDEGHRAGGDFIRRVYAWYQELIDDGSNLPDTETYWGYGEPWNLVNCGVDRTRAETQSRLQGVPLWTRRLSDWTRREDGGD